jgi:hypothetical protein
MCAHLGIERLQDTGEVVEVARHTDQDVVANDERRVRRPVTALRVGDDDIPLHLAGVGIERDQMRIRRRQVDRILVDRGAAMADVEPLIRRVGVAPQLPRRSGVDRPDVVGSRDVDDAVDEDRRRLELLGLAGLERPRQRQLTNVLWRDLRQLAVALAGKIAVVSRPIVLRRWHSVQKHQRGARHG